MVPERSAPRLRVCLLSCVSVIGVLLSFGGIVSPQKALAFPKCTGRVDNPKARCSEDAKCDEMDCTRWISCYDVHMLKDGLDGDNWEQLVGQRNCGTKGYCKGDVEDCGYGPQNGVIQTPIIADRGSCTVE